MKLSIIPVKNLLLGLICLHHLLSASEMRKTGTAGFVFLEIPVTARSVALGQTGVTLVDAHIDGLYLNPALIALAPTRNAFHLTYANWYVDTRHQAFGLIHRIPLFGTLGFQLIYFDFGSMEKTRLLTPGEAYSIQPGDNNTYYSLGEYSANAFSLGCSYSRQLTDKFSFGATLKYVRETIDAYDADNLIADLGFMYFTGFRSLRVGAFLQNFGLESAYEDEKFRMPQKLTLGISQELWGDFGSPNHVTVLLEAAHPNDAAEHVHFGAEALLANLIYLRTGYKIGYDYEKFSYGIGVRPVYRGRKMAFDIAYMQHELLENSTRFSLSLEF